MTTRRSTHWTLPAALDTVIPVGDTLYGIAARTGMWTSTDDGRTWSHAPDDPHAS